MMGDYTEHLISMAGGDGDCALDLDAIHARADAATEGPWVIDSIESGEHAIFAEEHHRLGCGSSQVAGFLTAENAAFLHAARTDVPALLDLVREQAAQIKRVRALAEGFDEKASQASYFGSEDQMETWLSAANCLRAALTATDQP